MKLFKWHTTLGRKHKSNVEQKELGKCVQETEDIQNMFKVYKTQFGAVLQPYFLYGRTVYSTSPAWPRAET